MLCNNCLLWESEGLQSHLKLSPQLLCNPICDFVSDLLYNLLVGFPNGLRFTWMCSAYCWMSTLTPITCTQLVCLGHPSIITSIFSQLWEIKVPWKLYLTGESYKITKIDSQWSYTQIISVIKQTFTYNPFKDSMWVLRSKCDWYSNTCLLPFFVAGRWCLYRP